MVQQEREALELLTRLPPYVWDGATLPLPVEEIAESVLGLRVRDVPGAEMAAAASAEHVSGLLLVDDREIWVNAEESAAWPGRRRFTIGHEIGHWMLHRDGHESGIFCRGAQIRLDEAAPDIEAEATIFAGGLLFPDALVRLEWDRLGGDFDALRERFAGSRVATERAIFRAVREPEVRARGLAGITGFYWDEDGFGDWLRRHPVRGHVVSDGLIDPARSRLHRADCSHLTRTTSDAYPHTRSPKWCSLDVAALRRAVPEARRCSRCG